MGTVLNANLLLLSEPTKFYNGKFVQVRIIALVDASLGSANNAVRLSSSSVFLVRDILPSMYFITAYAPFMLCLSTESISAG